MREKTISMKRKNTTRRHNIPPAPVPVWLRWMRFNIAGALGVLVQMSVLAVATRLFGVDYLWATVIAVECALLHNFMWHELYTWQEHRLSRTSSAVMSRLLRYNLSVGSFSILGNLLLMRWLTGGWQMPVLLANLIAITLLSAGNFLITHYHVFDGKVIIDGTVPAPRWATAIG